MYGLLEMTEIILNKIMGINDQLYTVRPLYFLFIFFYPVTTVIKTLGRSPRVILQ